MSVVGSLTVMPVTQSFLPATLAAPASGAALMVSLAVLLSGRRTVGRTTLNSAWWWTVAGILAWSAVELANSWSLLVASSAAALRLAAQALSFCPAIAVLGAKRPQHVAWNFVVLSLWAVVALPAAETFLLRRGYAVAVGDARGAFLWLLIALGPINYLPTRFWLGSLLLAAGQVVALSRYLPLIRQSIVAQESTMGLCLVAAALVAAWAVSRRSHRRGAYDGLWLDFRDAFGLFWSLRVQQRVNELARQNGWDLDLRWSGFRRRTTGDVLPSIDAEIESTLRTSLKGLLRRFVDGAWIDEQLTKPSETL